MKPVVIHRDLKTHNVLRAHSGSLKVCDFGLVKVRNTRAGTPAYMAPELLNGASFNKSVDVYAFAVLLNELYSGRVPFYMMDVNDLRERVVAGDRPALPMFGCPQRILRIITRCWYSTVQYSACATL